MATKYTIVYTTPRVAFSIPLRAFSIDQIIVYYSTNTTSPAPADVQTGAADVTADCTFDGIDERANAFTVNYPTAPATGTIIVEIRGNANRVTTFVAGRMPSSGMLDDEFDHAYSLFGGFQGGNVVDNLQTLRDDIDTNETDITALEGRATALEALDPLLRVGGVWDAEADRITDVANPTAAQDAATKTYVDGKTFPGDTLPTILLAEVNLPLIATDDDPQAAAWQVLGLAGLATEVTDELDKLPLRLELIDVRTLAAGFDVEATADGVPEDVDNGLGDDLISEELPAGDYIVLVIAPASCRQTANGVLEMRIFFRVAYGASSFPTRSVFLDLPDLGAIIVDDETYLSVPIVYSRPVTLAAPGRIRLQVWRGAAGRAGAVNEGSSLYVFKQDTMP